MGAQGQALSDRMSEEKTSRDEVELWNRAMPACWLKVCVILHVDLNLIPYWHAERIGGISSIGWVSR